MGSIKSGKPFQAWVMITTLLTMFLSLSVGNSESIIKNRKRIQTTSELIQNVPYSPDLEYITIFGMIIMDENFQFRMDSNSLHSFKNEFVCKFTLLIGDKEWDRDCIDSNQKNEFFFKTLISKSTHGSAFIHLYSLSKDKNLIWQTEFKIEDVIELNPNISSYFSEFLTYSNPFLLSSPSSSKNLKNPTITLMEETESSKYALDLIRSHPQIENVCSSYSQMCRKNFDALSDSSNPITIEKHFQKNFTFMDGLFSFYHILTSSKQKMNAFFYSIENLNKFIFSFFAATVTFIIIIMFALVRLNNRFDLKKSKAFLDVKVKTVDSKPPSRTPEARRKKKWQIIKFVTDEDGFLIHRLRNNEDKSSMVVGLGEDHEAWDLVQSKASILLNGEAKEVEGCFHGSGVENSVWFSFDCISSLRTYQEKKTGKWNRKNSGSGRLESIASD